MLYEFPIFVHQKEVADFGVKIKSASNSVFYLMAVVGERPSYFQYIPKVVDRDLFPNRICLIGFSSAEFISSSNKPVQTPRIRQRFLLSASRYNCIKRQETPQRKKAVSQVKLEHTLQFQKDMYLS